jgi:hypothetical protein
LGDSVTGDAEKGRLKNRKYFLIYKKTLDRTQKVGEKRGSASKSVKRRLKPKEYSDVY